MVPILLSPTKIQIIEFPVPFLPVYNEYKGLENACGFMARWVTRANGPVSISYAQLSWEGLTLSLYYRAPAQQMLGEAH
jgi:hypothetical protein